MRKVLFFIGTLQAGGKERRFIELLSFLKSSGDYDMVVVTASTEIDFPVFPQLNIPLRKVKNNAFLKSIFIPIELMGIVNEFQPDLIHTWGRMQSFYMLPAKIFNKIPIINGQITDAAPHISLFNRIIDRLNFRFSDVILSNSYAGIDAYRPPEVNSKVIYNGMDLSRFENLPAKEEIKMKYGITTPYVVVMVANVSKNKDYKMFYTVASKVIEMRDDVSFVGVGFYDKEDPLYHNCQQLIQGNRKLMMTGGIDEVEAFVNACDIGVLFSNTEVHGEGLSNAVLEYMALGKPVVANDAGGTREVLKNEENGYLITDETTTRIAEKIVYLLSHNEIRINMGISGRSQIEKSFTIQKMGERFVDLYNAVLEGEREFNKKRS